MTHKKTGGLEGLRNGSKKIVGNGGKDGKEITPRNALRELRGGLLKAPADQKEALLHIIKENIDRDGSFVLWHARRESLQDTSGANPPAFVELLNKVMPVLFTVGKPLEGKQKMDVEDVISKWCGEKEFVAWFEDGDEIQLKIAPADFWVRVADSLLKP